METNETKTTIGFLLLLITITFILYLFKDTQRQSFNAKERLIYLEQVNDSLNKEISLERIKIIELKLKIDTLQRLKPQIIYKYVEKNKSIDNANVNDLVVDFKGVFAKSNVK